MAPLPFLVRDLSRAIRQSLIEGITAEAEVGQIYTGKVNKIADFGAFVNILPGKDGLVHISQIAKERVEKVTDYLSEGQEVRVIVLDVERGRIKLSMKEVPEEEAQADEASDAEETAQHSDDASATNEAR